MRLSWRHRPRRTALVAAGALVVGGLVTVPMSPAQAATACDVEYTTNDWPGGFTANLTIRNLGDPINGWTLGFAFPGNQRVTQGWSANWSQSGNQVTATNMPWNASIPTNGSTSIGFNGSWSGSNPKPDSFTINGVTCGGAANQAPTVSITSPADNASFTAPANFTINATASDADGSVTQVEFFRDGMLLSTDTTAPYSHAVSALPAGDYTFQARATDNGGLSSTAEISVHVTEPTGPSITATPTSLTVAEGDSGSVNLKLSAQPSGNVPVSLSKTGDPDITLGASSVTLTPTNWNTGVNVSVNAAQDADTTNGSATVTASASGYTPATFTVTEADDDVPQAGEYTERFLTQYNKIKAPSNGYFSPEGVPYHSVETLIVEAPDHGHETTSEAFSFWLWLEAQYGRIQGDWEPFNNAWNVMERYIIPAHADQTSNNYNPNDPATYAPEFDTPDQYPSPLDDSVTPGQDPLYNELQSTYGNNDMYSMHWLTPTATATAATAPPSRRTSTPTSAAPRSRSSRPSRTRPARPSTSAAATASCRCSSRTRSTPGSGATPTPRTPTRAPSRPRTGRSPGRPSRASSRRSRPPWPRRPRWVTTCATRCTTSTSSSPAAPRRPARPDPARTAPTTC